MRWHEPIIIIIAVLIGAYLGSRFPSINVLKKVPGL